MFSEHLTPVHGYRNGVWWLRSSVLRPKHIFAIAEIVRRDGDVDLMAGTGPTSLSRVSIEELFALAPNERLDAYVSGHVHVTLGRYGDLETVAGPMIRGASDRPELLAIQRYLKRNALPRFPSHVLPYLLVPTVVLLGAAVAGVVSSSIAPHSPALATIGISAAFGLAISIINERRKWKKEPPAPPPHRLVG